MCSYHRGLFSPSGTNHTDISASISLSLAIVYLQWNLSSFHCPLNLVILLYLLIKHPLSTTDLLTFLTHSSFRLLLSRFSFSVSKIFHTWLVIKKCSLIGWMSAVLFHHIRGAAKGAGKSPIHNMLQSNEYCIHNIILIFYIRYFSFKSIMYIFHNSWSHWYIIVEAIDT